MTSSILPISPPDPWLDGVPDASASPLDAIDLSGSTSPLGCPPLAARRAKEAVGCLHPDEGRTRGLLRQVISRRHSLPEEAVSLAAGTRLLLPALLETACEDDSGRSDARSRIVLLAAPAPPLHRLAAFRAGVPVVEAALQDVDAWIEGLRRVRPAAVVLGHPANPCGTCLSREDLLRVVEAALETDVVLIVDEAYAEYAADDVLRAAALIADFPHLVVTRSFSSLHGLAALPCAYALSSPDLARRLASRLLGAEPGHVAACTATAAVEEPSFGLMVADRVRRSRFRMGQHLKGWGVRVRCGQGPWVMAASTGRPDCLLRLAARGVRVRDLGPWGLDGWIRVRAGSDPETERFLAAAHEVLAPEV